MRWRDRSAYRRLNPKRYWATATLSNHRKAGYIVKISHRELVELANSTKLCRYCRRLLLWKVSQDYARSSTRSLDRINNSRILTKSNVQIICHRCNRTKGERTHKQFMADGQRALEAA